MAGEGPPPPGRVTLDSVPKSLRTYDKGLRVRAVYFDFGVMTRTIEMEEAAVGTHLVSGFDPRHERHRGYAQDSGPKHGARCWVDTLGKSDLQVSLQAYSLDSDSGNDDLRRDRLREEIRRMNKKWVDGLLAREMRKELGKMGLESSGKPWHLSDRLEDALFEGLGTAPDFGPWLAAKLPVENAESTAAALVKGLKLDVKIEAVAGGGFALRHSRDGAGGVEDEGALSDTIGGHTQTKAMSAAADLSDEKESGTSTPAFTDSTPKGLPKELSDVSTKYRALLNAKTGGMLSSMKVDNQRGDAEALNFGRALLVETQTAAKTAGSQWLLGSGVGGLLEYLERRSLRITLIPTDPNQDSTELHSFQSQCPGAVTLEVVDPVEVTLFMANGKAGNTATGNAETPPQVPDQAPTGLGGILQSLFSVGVVGKNTGRTKQRAPDGTKGWVRCLEAVALQQQMTLGEIVVVSDNNDLLRAARETRCHTIAFNPPNERRVDVSTDAQVLAISEVKEVIDQMNGISFRR